MTKSSTSLCSVSFVSRPNRDVVPHGKAKKMTDLGGSGSFYPPPGAGNQHAAGIANAQHAARSGSRIADAENMAELKAMRTSAAERQPIWKHGVAAAVVAAV